MCQGPPQGQAPLAKGVMPAMRCVLPLGCVKLLMQESAQGSSEHEWALLGGG